MDSGNGKDDDDDDDEMTVHGACARLDLGWIERNLRPMTESTSCMLVRRDWKRRVPLHLAVSATGSTETRLPVLRALCAAYPGTYRATLYAKDERDETPYQIGERLGLTREELDWLDLKCVTVDYVQRSLTFLRSDEEDKAE